MSASTTSELIAAFRAQDRRACARLLSLVENEPDASVAVLDELYPSTGRAFRVGITGPPGAGKSTLVEKLARECRKQGRRVGIIAVDPTSPFSGGAVLGDRVRMSSLFTDPGVFIRSMATRGGHGGLAVRTKEVCDVLDAFGEELIIIETVGVGQVELDIAATAHSTVVVLVPESGDSIQTMKAGLMEIGEIFCINKSDRDGADRLAMEIELMLELKRWDGWTPPVVKTVATSGTGVAELYSRLEQHREHLLASNTMTKRRREALKAEIVQLVQERLMRNIWRRPRIADELSQLVEQVLAGQTTPYRAATVLEKQLWSEQPPRSSNE